MKKPNNYLFLASLFFTTYLILEFTNIYDDSAWVKVFVLIIFFTFLISGISAKWKG